MKQPILFLLAVLFSVAAFAQTSENASSAHRIVFQVSSDDSLVHKALIRQIRNVTSVSPGIQIEVVCHGPGLDMVLTETSTVAKGITEQSGKGIVFVGCEFTLRQRNITKEALLPEVGTVESALLEIVKKQEEGWSYIKAGF